MMRDSTIPIRAKACGQTPNLLRHFQLAAISAADRVPAGAPVAEFLPDWRRSFRVLAMDSYWDSGFAAYDSRIEVLSGLSGSDWCTKPRIHSCRGKSR